MALRRDDIRLRARLLAGIATCAALGICGSASAASTGGATVAGIGGKGSGGGIYGVKVVRHVTHAKHTTKTSTTSKAKTRSTPARRVKYVQTPLGSRLPLKASMRGSDVRSLQRRLVKLGQDLDQDGDFGAETEHALSEWEAASGRPVDGVLDAADHAAMTAAVRPAAALVTPGATSAGPPPPSPLQATIGLDGLAVAPVGAPAQVIAFIAAANAIAKTPYVYGGGHKSFVDTGYDCSGSTSYALHGAGLLDYTMVSGEMESYGEAGPGQWITLYANADHVFVVVAGIRYDTSGQTQAGTRWQPLSTRSNWSGYVVRHPSGL